MRRGPDGARRGAVLDPAVDTEVVLYDFRRPTKMARDHVRVLQMSLDTFARRLGTLLTSQLRVLCTFNLLAIEQQTYEEYIGGLATPTLLAPFTTKPLTGTSVLEFSVGTALSCVDHLLGGPGGTQPSRTLTDIESVLMRGLIEQMLGVLRYGLEPVAAIETELANLDFNPPFLQASGATDMMIITSFESRIGEASGVFTLCLPFASFFPRLQMRGAQRQLSAGEQLSARNSARQVRENLGDVALELALQFDPVRLSPAQIAELAPGDLIALPHRVTAPLSLRCGDATYTKAIVGREGTRLAGLVVDNSLEK